SAALPDYMVPSTFVALDALPLSPNGKLDRRALPAPAPAAGAGPEPRTSSEVLVAALFCELLGVTRPGRTDDFFALGGHSLLAARLVAHVRDAAEVELPLRAVFEAPSVAGLAARVDALREAGHGLAVPKLEPVAGVGPHPLTFGQERLWFLERLEPGTARYNMPGRLRLTGALDVGALSRALTALVARQEALRTCFPEADGTPMQVILPPTTI
ncbi:MAG: hypothetical protein KC621_14745, partial [Myxococcales bacterium]|nr:hypothetical protein [Myxococcales bacterium]